MATSHGRAVLRVGIIESGSLTQERLLDLDAPITIGTAGTNTLVLAEGPTTVSLFEVSRAGMMLAPALQSTARMKRGQADEVLSFGVRGRVALAGNHVLYQLVSAPVAPAVPDRFDFRAPWFEEGDPALVPSLAAWSGLGLLLAVYVTVAAPRQIDTNLELLPPEGRQITMVMTPPPPPPLLDEKVVVERAVENTGPKNPTTEPEGGPTTPGKKAVEAEVHRQSIEAKMAGLIGTAGDSPWEIGVDDAVAMDDLAADRAGIGEDDLDGPRQIADSLGAADVAQGRLEGGTGDGIGGGPLVTVTQPEANLGELEEDADQAKVRATLRRYRGHVKGCYDNLLKTHPEAGGRISIGLSVADGRVESVWLNQSLGFPAFDKCVLSRANRWDFPTEVNGGIEWPVVLHSK